MSHYSNGYNSVKNPGLYHSQPKTYTERMEYRQGVEQAMKEEANTASVYIPQESEEMRLYRLKQEQDFMYGLKGAEITMNAEQLKRLKKQLPKKPVFKPAILTPLWRGLVVGVAILGFFGHKIGMKNAIPTLIITIISVMILSNLKFIFSRPAASDK